MMRKSHNHHDSHDNEPVNQEKKVTGADRSWDVLVDG